MVHTKIDWNAIAVDVAQHAQQARALIDRGAILVRLVDDTQTPVRFVEEGPPLAAVFGNDDYVRDQRARREVEWVRRRLEEATAQELGFGVSADGCTWALLVGENGEPCETEAGRSLQRELLKTFLEDSVNIAWARASGIFGEDGDANV